MAVRDGHLEDSALNPRHVCEVHAGPYAAPPASTRRPPPSRGLDPAPSAPWFGGTRHPFAWRRVARSADFELSATELAVRRSRRSDRFVHRRRRRLPGVSVRGRGLGACAETLARTPALGISGPDDQHSLPQPQTVSPGAPLRQVVARVHARQRQHSNDASAIGGEPFNSLQVPRPVARVTALSAGIMPPGPHVLDPDLRDLSQEYAQTRTRGVNWRSNARQDAGCKKRVRRSSRADLRRHARGPCEKNRNPGSASQRREQTAPRFSSRA